MADLNIWAFLGSLSKRNHQTYDKLDADQQKSVSPFVIMRWLCGTNDPEQILRMQNSNRYMFQIKDKSILFKILALACNSKTYKYNWIKAPGSSGSNKLRTEVIAKYFDVSLREAKTYIDRLKPTDIMEMAEGIGLEKEDITKLAKELDIKWK